MKKFGLIINFLLCVVIISLAQEPSNKNQSPKENIVVNRQYDEKGNLIRFDSLYSYSWSSDSNFIKSFDSEKFFEYFSSKSDFFHDSIFFDNSVINRFFNNNQFTHETDSILKNRFKNQFDFFDYNNMNDSISNFNELDRFFENLFENRNDTFRFRPDDFRKPNSVDEMMLLFRKQMLEMEEFRRKLFNEK